MTDDPTLLRRYATERTEEAFAELVQRHLPLVFSAALRRLGGDVHRAEDIAQVVFSTVARDAEKLSHHATLTGWLYVATRNAVIDSIRSEKRRRVREEEAHMMHENSLDPAAPSDWSQLRPVLDTAMDALSTADRDAVLLRFFQGHTFSQVGGALGLSEEAARKRVDRALDKLRDVLQRHHISSTAAALAALLAAQTVSAAPAHLAPSITGAAVTAGAVASTATGGIIAMTVTKLHLTLAAALVIAGCSVLVIQQRTISGLRESLAQMQQQLTKLSPANDVTSPPRSTPPLLTRGAIPLSGEARASAENASIAPTFQRQSNLVSTTPEALNERTAALKKPLPDTDEVRREKGRLHSRYERFFQQRKLSEAQAERMVELIIHQSYARQDLQDSVRAANIPGDTPGIESLRSKLYAPINREMREILGDEGYDAYNQYQSTSFLRVVYLEPLLPFFAGAHVTLSPQQEEQFIPILAANRRSTRAQPTDIGSVSSMDWNGVVQQAGAFLNPTQVQVLQNYAKMRN